MSFSLNEVTVAGNITQDLELKTIGNGSQVVRISIAINESYKDKTGQKVEKVEYQNIVFWNQQAETICKFLKKGDPIYVRGSLETKKWEDKNGQKRSSVEIKGQYFKFLPKGEKRQGGNYQQSQQPQKQFQNQSDNLDEQDVPF